MKLEIVPVQYHSNPTEYTIVRLILKDLKKNTRKDNPLYEFNLYELFIIMIITEPI